MLLFWVERVTRTSGAQFDGTHIGAATRFCFCNFWPQIQTSNPGTHVLTDNDFYDYFLFTLVTAEAFRALMHQ